MYKMMASNIVNKVKKDSFRRIDVNFVIPEKYRNVKKETSIRSLEEQHIFSSLRTRIL
jgi:hypothetical protein